MPAIPAQWVLLLLLAAMCAAVWLLAGSGRRTRIALTAGALAGGLLLTLPTNRTEAVTPIGHAIDLGVIVLLLGFLVYAVAVLLRALLHARRVDANTLFGAINLYSVIGLIWSLVYAIQAWLQPGAFHFSQPHAEAASVHSLASFVYYSFITQATQGYGDITPVYPFTRSLVVIHTILGQFYMAIVIAYFLGLYIAGNGRPGN